MDRTAKSNIVINGKKVCCDCRELKILEDFYLVRKGHGNRAKLCKDCSNIRRRGIDHKIPRHIVKNIRKDAMGSKCPLCLRIFSSDRGARACIDHDHNSGVLRGVICERCNSALGYIADSSDTAHRMALYLEFYLTQ